MSTGKKITLGVFVFLFIVLVAVVIIVPLMFDLDRYRPQVVATIRQETGKPAQIGHLALTIFPRVSIRVDDLALGNPVGFPKGDFVTARRIYAVVDAFALWDRKVVIHSLELNDPAINLLSDIRGKWNFESASPAKAAADSKPGKSLCFP